MPLPTKGKDEKEASMAPDSVLFMTLLEKKVFNCCCNGFSDGLLSRTADGSLVHTVIP